MGAFRDHFATTWSSSSHPQALRGYEKLDILGLLPNSSNALNDNSEYKCECLQEIVQLFDEQPGLGGDSTKPGLFGRLDHKLVKMGEESNQLFENYMRTGERLYCVPEFGQCGASIPLYQWFSASEIDNFVTTREELDLAHDTNIKSKGVLCYIWSHNYKSGQKAAPITDKKIIPKMDEKNNIPIAGGFQTYTRTGPSEIKKVTDLACPTLTATNGQWSYTSLMRTPGTIGFLNCNTGYAIINGTLAIVCQRTGRWLPEPPTCNLSGCPPIEHEHSNPTQVQGRIVYNSVVVADQRYPVGTTAMLICSERMDVSHNGADISYCTLSGWQPRKLGKCEKICPKIHVENANIVYADSHGLDQVTNTDGTIATLICPFGTNLIGKGTAECSDGKWDNENIGECKMLNCPVLKSIDGGRLTYYNAKSEPTNPLIVKIIPGTIVRLTCGSDSNLKGAGESMCHTTETWQPEIGICE
uniref:Sushi domain-containing protein n=1 Tax=Panagrolaimus superbus TaxID=310955 RepID=A0A914XV42_9BILA